MESIYIDEIEYRKCEDNYYVNKYGEVYSLHSKKILKHSIDIDGYHRIDIKGKHKKIHKLVWMCWGENSSYSDQVNHIDDNKSNNCIDNLYSGTQSENMRDCAKNKHKIGNSKILIVKEKLTNECLIFYPANNFLDYANKSYKNHGVGRALTKKWFHEKYELIMFGKGVTTIPDECKGAGWSLSPFGARCIPIMV